MCNYHLSNLRELYTRVHTYSFCAETMYVCMYIYNSKRALLRPSFNCNLVYIPMPPPPSYEFINKLFGISVRDSRRQIVLFCMSTIVCKGGGA